MGGLSPTERVEVEGCRAGKFSRHVTLYPSIQLRVQKQLAVGRYLGCQNVGVDMFFASLDLY